MSQLPIAVIAERDKADATKREQGTLKDKGAPPTTDVSVSYHTAGQVPQLNFGVSGGSAGGCRLLGRKGEVREGNLSGWHG